MKPVSQLRLLRFPRLPFSLFFAVLPSSDNMFSSSGEAYKPQDHHKGMDELWKEIRKEAKEDSVRC
jgi:hypothetical protein